MNIMTIEVIARVGLLLIAATIMVRRGTKLVQAFGDLAKAIRKLCEDIRGK